MHALPSHAPSTPQSSQQSSRLSKHFVPSFFLTSTKNIMLKVYVSQPARGQCILQHTMRIQHPTPAITLSCIHTPTHNTSKLRTMIPACRTNITCDRKVPSSQSYAADGRTCLDKVMPRSQSARRTPSYA